MNKKVAIIGGAVAAGALTYFLSTTKGRKLRNELTSSLKDYTDQLKEKSADTQSEAEEILKLSNERIQNGADKLSDKISDFIIDNKQAITSVAGLILPILVKRATKRFI